MNKNILILGKGYIGTYLASYLKSNNNNVVHISKSDLDYTNPANFELLLKKHNETYHGRIDWVINCSAYTGNPSIDSCEDHKEDCFNYNVLVPLHLTKVCNNINIPIIHFSTGCLYEGYEKIFTEQDVPNLGIDCYGSSFYSKTKDCFERLSSSMQRHIFRIRLPFNGVYEPKNYLFKLINYDNITSNQNSITCVDDLLVFVDKFTDLSDKLPQTGIYNVVNTGSVDNFTVLDMLKERGISNKKWKFISELELNLKAKRSNCIISTEKIKLLNLELPSVTISLKKSIDLIYKQWTKLNKGVK